MMRVYAFLLLATAASVQCLNMNAPLPAGSWKRLLVSGQKVGNVTFGLTQDSTGKPIYANNYEKGVQLDTLDISQAPDHSAMFQVGNKLYMTAVQEFFPPSNQYLAELSMNKQGDLSVDNLKVVDWSQWGGLWCSCSGQMTKVGSKVMVMVGEEYECNARRVAAATSMEDLRSGFESDPYYYGYADVVNFMRYYGKYPFANNMSLPLLTIQDVKTTFKPYMYGYIASLEMSSNGTYKTVKYMTMGRFSHEMGYAMPDQKTVYLTDDQGTGGGIFLFKADRPKDFSSGKLYAMKATQTSPTGGNPAQAAFTLTWTLLGSAKNSDLLANARNTSFTDIFDLGSGNKTTGECPAGFTPVNTATGFECLKLKAGKEKLAAFFETRRYAAMLGATTEFSKGEGIAFDKNSGSLYISMSSVRYGMEDWGKKAKNSTSYDAGGPNHIRLAYNPCGCIFKLSMKAGTYLASAMSAAVCGAPINKDAAGNTCDPASIAGPDNLEVLDGKLLIAEDSEGSHVKNSLWSMDPATGKLTQLMSMPTPANVNYTEAEFTSIYQYKLRSNRYLMTNVNNYDFNAGVPGQVGYIGPL